MLRGTRNVLSGAGVDLRQHGTIGPDQFGTLLALLVASFLVSGVSDGVWPRLVVSTTNLGVLLAGFAATGAWAERRRIWVLLVTGVLSSVIVGSFSQTSVIAGLAALGQVVVLAAVLVAVVRRVLSHDRVGMPTITGAVAAYFLIGMVFAWLYQAAYGLLDLPILSPEEPGLPAYYSFVVLSSLGFGDVTPVDELVKRVTAMEAVTGQIFLATLVARLVSMYGSRTHTE